MSLFELMYMYKSIQIMFVRICIVEECGTVQYVVLHLCFLHICGCDKYLYSLCSDWVWANVGVCTVYVYRDVKGFSIRVS